MKREEPVGAYFRQRRSLIRLTGLAAIGLLAPFTIRAAEKRSVVAPVAGDHDQLREPDVNGMRLLPGYQSRIVARSGVSPCSGSDYIWHDAPDGGATIATPDGGWVYVSNSEVDKRRGGVGALHFSANGDIINAYSILTGTSRNCAGNMTSWGSYLSCEEHGRGLVWECDPLGRQVAQARPALGRFNHESVVIDPATQQLYLTEDHPEGRLYRFTAAQKDERGFPDLDHGVLEVAQIVKNEQGYGLVWYPLPDPSARRQPTRVQVKDSTPFRGGEGICYLLGRVYFVTKGDDRVWAFNTRNQTIAVLYDANYHHPAILRGVDNIVPTPAGDLLISEDGGDMQLVTLALSGQVQPFLQLQGHDRSELTGLAYAPDGRRLYVSSQRGSSGQPSGGVVYEISRSTP